MRNRPIRMQFVMAFLSFMVLLVLCLFIANLFFLKPYYVWIKTGELQTLSDRIVKQGAATDSESFEQIVDDALYRSQAAIDIYDKNGGSMFSTRNSKDQKERKLQETFDSNEWTRMKEGAAITREREEKDHDMVNLSTYQLLPNGNLVSLSSNMAPTDKIVRIFNQFLLLVCGLFLIVAWLWANRFATYFSKPIVGLQQLAHRMTQFDFSRGWGETRRDELGDLGEDMNQLSGIIEQFTQELKGKNEQLETELARKIQLEQMRKMFVSNVSHELKTPIALIQGYAEGLRQNVNEDPESRSEYCELFDIQAGIQEMVIRLQNLYDPQQVRFELDSPAAATWVHGDESKINQVINNYLTNAAYFTHKPGLVRVTLEGHAGCMRVSVYNTDSHIPEEELAHIWESFYKTDKARTRMDSGTGLGLSIVKGIMDMHKSSFGAYNAEHGVVFWFELPLVGSAARCRYHRTFETAD